MRFEQQDLAEPRKDLAHRQEIAVPAAVVEDGEHALALRRQRDQLVGFVERDCERLVDDDMLAGFERAFANGKWLCVGRRDDDEVGAFDQFVERVDAIGRIARWSAPHASSIRSHARIRGAWKTEPARP